MFNLQEAFSKLNMMESGDFDLLNNEEKDDMANFLDSTEDVMDVEIIDPEVTEESELEDSYVGKIVVQCPVCRSLIYKTKADIDEEGEDPQTCPYCFSVENFDLVGKIVPIEDETAPEVVEVEASASDEKDLNENLENVTVETEDQVITVSAENKEECPECDEADMPTEEPATEEHEEAEVIAPLDSPDNEPDGFEIEEVDEESFDEFAESLLKEKYSNIVSYKTRKMKDCKTHIMAEGVVTLKNGQKRLTEFRIRPSRISKSGRGTCLVENMQLKTRKVVRTKVM